MSQPTVRTFTETLLYRAVALRRRGEHCIGLQKTRYDPSAKRNVSCRLQCDILKCCAASGQNCEYYLRSITIAQEVPARRTHIGQYSTSRHRTRPFKSVNSGTGNPHGEATNSTPWLPEYKTCSAIAANARAHEAGLTAAPHLHTLKDTSATTWHAEFPLPSYTALSR